MFFSLVISVNYQVVSTLVLYVKLFYHCVQPVWEQSQNFWAFAQCRGHCAGNKCSQVSYFYCCEIALWCSCMSNSLHRF